MKYFVLIILTFSSINFCIAQKLRNEYEYTAKDDFAELKYKLWSPDTIIQHEKIVIDGFDSKVPFYQYSNRPNKNKFVILLHGLSSSKESWITRSERAKLVDSLLLLGYNIIIPDAKYHGERSYELNFRPAGSLPPKWSKSQEDAKSFCHVYYSTIRDIRIIMDYLEKQNFGEKLQFDLVGYSMGGAMSLIINAVDTRINSVVACVPPVNRPISEIKDFGWPVEITESLKDISPKYYNSIQNSPVALLMGRTDFFTSEQEATQFYEKIPNKDKRLIFYEAGHMLPPDNVIDIIAWITAHDKK